MSLDEARAELGRAIAAKRATFGALLVLEALKAQATAEAEAIRKACIGIGKSLHSNATQALTQTLTQANPLRKLDASFAALKKLLDPDELQEAFEEISDGVEQVGADLVEHLDEACYEVVTELEGQVTQVFDRGEDLVERIVDIGETIAAFLTAAKTIGDAVAEGTESAGSSLQVADEITMRTQEAISTL